MATRFHTFDETSAISAPGGIVCPCQKTIMKTIEFKLTEKTGAPFVAPHFAIGNAFGMPELGFIKILVGKYSSEDPSEAHPSHVALLLLTGINQSEYASTSSYAFIK